MWECMKKQNNRYRNGNNANNGYTLNYKFDSVSIAGKISGTALDLIRRYNDLAKEAQSCGNYVEMEVYRQYAEHYRKIVTDINERRQPRSDNQNNQNKVDENNSETSEAQEDIAEKKEPVEITPAANGYVETLPASEPTKTFTVVEVTELEAETIKEDAKPKKVVRKRATTPRKKAETKEPATKVAEA